jgi:succinyl-CoA synthetase alpha subunit
MAILLNENSKVIVQGMTGSEGKKHTERMIKSGTKIVGGVTPGKGGQSLEVAGQNVPVLTLCKKQWLQLVQMFQWFSYHRNLPKVQLLKQ